MKSIFASLLTGAICIAMLPSVAAQTVAPISIPSFTLGRQASLWDDMPSPLATDTISGLAVPAPSNAVCRTRVADAATDSTLWILDSLKGSAYFYIEGEYAGKTSDGRIKLPPMLSSSALEIFLLADSPQSSGSFSGISRLNADGSKTPIGNWRIYTIPVDYSYAASRQYSTDAVPVGPAYYKGSFSIAAPGNTWLDLSGWDTGILYLNGKAIARYSGDDSSVAVDAADLRQGENEIILLDVSGPRARPSLQAYASPRGTAYTASGKKTSMAGAPASLDKDLIVAEGSIPASAHEVEIPLAFPVNTRYVAVELVSGDDAGAALAEVRLIGPGIHSQNRDRWRASTYVAGDSDLPAHHPGCVIDMDNTTYWQSAAGSSYPHTLLIDMADRSSIQSVTLVPAQTAGYRPARYRIYAF